MTARDAEPSLLLPAATSADAEAAEARLHSLLQANRLLVEDLELPVVLRRVIEVATDLVGARYGALGVLGPQGGLEQFIHVGVGQEAAARIGHLPEGRGLLGALIEDPSPIRLERLGDDPRAEGFPAGHPAMASFLGVPIRVRGAVYGNLYLADPAAGAFSEADETLVTALAANAGIAITNARSLEEARRRQRWSQSTAEITASLLAGGDALQMVADTLASLAEADLVTVALPSVDEANASVETAGGPLAASVRGRVFPWAGGLLAQTMASERPQLVVSERRVEVDDAPVDLAPAMVIPLLDADRTVGVMTVARRATRRPFDESDLQLAAEFAGHASVALILARGRDDRIRLALLEDRGRIARDLHDHVIQRLFGTGMSLQAMGSMIDDPSIQARVEEQVVAIDRAIAQIRTAVFALTQRRPSAQPSLRHRILDLVGELTASGGLVPTLTFQGPVDALVAASLADDVVAVARESLANIARHAGASWSHLAVRADGTGVEVLVEDDGVGVGSSTRRSGLVNLERRAAARGGSSVLSRRQPTGTSLRWTAPLEPGETA